MYEVKVITLAQWNESDGMVYTEPVRLHRRWCNRKLELFELQ